MIYGVGRAWLWCQWVLKLVVGLMVAWCVVVVVVCQCHVRPVGVPAAPPSGREEEVPHRAHLRQGGT